jgi:hypothetical protein
MTEPELELEVEEGSSDLGELVVEVPWGQRPAWDYGLSGGPTTWVPDPRASERVDAKAPKAEAPTGVVHIANGLVDLAAPPPAYATMRAKAEKAGWLCHRRWGAADVATRKLVPAAEGEESGHFEVELVPMLSVSLRMGRAGHSAYAIWSVAEAPGAKWAYVGGGVDGIHGVKVLALGKALVEA